jgi:exodeoxyribonuclease VII large subunit
MSSMIGEPPPDARSAAGTAPSAGLATGAAPPASRLPGPFPVGTYAIKLKQRLRQLARVQLVGEVWGLRIARSRVYFELRDGRGALPCSMWLDDFERLGLPLSDGMRVVAGGGCDLYPGSASASPAFSFAVTELRVEGEGDLLLALARLRRQLAAEGLFELQKRLPRPPLPRTIGVVTGAGGKAGDDVLAGLRRRGWGGRLVWAHAPVQDRRAAPAIAAALRDLAALDGVEVVIVARGGGSLADLFAFCDEALCRTVALLRVPVIASVGHHTDRTLIDDVAAIACSTPTHAAEAAVPLHCAEARAGLHRAARRLESHADQAVLGRARTLATLSRAPAQQVARHRRELHQLLRELRASSRRAPAAGRAAVTGRAVLLERQADRALEADRARRSGELERLALALAAHDPARTLARGYALVEDEAGEPLGSAAATRAAARVNLRFHDGSLPAQVVEEP